MGCNVKVGNLVKYSDSYKDTTGIITSVKFRYTVRGSQMIAEVYWSSDKVLWEYVDELEVL